MSKLVDILVDAALNAVDTELDAVSNQVTSQTAPTAKAGDEEEEILWEGRPLLSLTVNYYITDERIRISEGLLGKSWTDVELVRVQAMDFKQSMTERAMSIGDIFIATHDPNNPKLTLENIKNPKDVHEILRRAVLKAREKYNLHYREEM